MKKLVFVLLASFLVLAACGKDKELNLNELTESFEEADLLMADIRDMEKDDYGMAPMKAEKAKIFEVKDSKNARIFKFDNEKDLVETKDYYDKLGEESAMLYSHTFSKGDFLIQMNGDIDKSIFKKYEKVMKNEIE
ncbi:hypothetical protein [Staphylococcus equorum]|uniref:hypothetical protein n=1 Tax=Staphylococcus equorum TaxID=246432 RepID=UPI002552D4B8|nr:hypothetical protein [Staphylococcus equorum]MDK9853178.1 hypothetical protein [Staphylococcus equorum]